MATVTLGANLAPVCPLLADCKIKLDIIEVPWFTFRGHRVFLSTTPTEPNYRRDTEDAKRFARYALGDAYTPSEHQWLYDLAEKLNAAKDGDLISMTTKELGAIFTTKGPRVAKNFAQIPVQYEVVLE